MLTTALLAAAGSGAQCDSSLVWEESPRAVFQGGGAYPRMYSLSDGTYLIGFDAPLGAKNARIAVVRSTDGTKTWSKPVVAAEKEGYDCANANFIELSNGDILLAYRAIKGGEKTDAKILCSVSHDGGETFEFHSTIIETYGRGGVWEPHFIEIGGKVAVFYANDSESAVGDTGFQNIEFKFLEEDGSWSDVHIASNGNETRSRDGMPVVDRLSDGRYIMVVEANQFPDYVFVVQIKFSPDGIDWSDELKTVYRPRLKGQGKKAGAPYICVLDDDTLVVSFQTDEDASQNGDNKCMMKIITSTDLGKTWSKPFAPFHTPDGHASIWNGMYYKDNTLFALTSASYPMGGIYLRRAHPTNPAEK